MKRLLLPALVLLSVVALSCGDDDTASVGGDDPTGMVAIRLDEVEGFFIEGFEIGLRFETGGGDVIATTLWSDFVTASGGGDAIEDFYETMLEQSVPAGPVVVLATVNIGIGPGPEIPDVDGDLRCRLELDVPADGIVDVQVDFSGTDDCLSEI